MTLHLIQLAVHNIRSRRTRSWLTILGVLIGVTAVVALLSIGTGVEKAVLQEFKDIGYDIIVIAPGGAARAAVQGAAGPQLMMGDGPPDLATPAGSATSSQTRTFTPGQIGAATGAGDTIERTFSPGQIGATASTPATRAATTVDTEALLANVPGLLEAGNLGTRIVSVETPAASGFLRLTTPSLAFLRSFPSTLGGFAIGEGTTFTTTAENEVVIGARSAESLGVAVGDSVTIDGATFEVVGILAPSKSAASGETERSRTTQNGTARALTGSGSGASFLTRGMTNTDDSLFVLDERATSVWSGATTNATTIVRMATGVDVAAVMANISTELTAQNVRGTPVSVQQIAGSIQGTLGMIETVLASIAAVALIVGGVGLMNTMYTAVLERTREIGILKAIGARDSHVMALFLIDSGLMGFIGGTLGLALGGVLSVLGTRLLGPTLGVGTFAPSFGAGLIVGALVASFVVGALSGAWPAWRASRLNPVEALASE